MTTPADPAGGPAPQSGPAAPAEAPAARVDGRAARWEAHRRQRRVALVDDTIRAIRRHGAGVGLDDVAAQAGTSKTVLYRHFDDRSGLYRAVTERVEGQIVGRVQASLREGAEPGEALASIIDAYLALVERDPELYRFVVRRPLVEGSLDDDPLVGISSQVADLLTGVLASDGVDQPVARTWAVALVGSVQACADEWLATAVSERIPRAELTRRLADLAWLGISYRG